jgi:hypothetical protein
MARILAAFLVAVLALVHVAAQSPAGPTACEQFEAAHDQMATACGPSGVLKCSPTCQEQASIILNDTDVRACADAADATIVPRLQDTRAYCGRCSGFESLHGQLISHCQPDFSNRCSRACFNDLSTVLDHAEMKGCAQESNGTLVPLIQQAHLECGSASSVAWMFALVGAVIAAGVAL